MDLVRVTNVSVSEVLDQSYDLAIFASGYEGRATYLAATVQPLTHKRSVVLGFRQARRNHQRLSNDAFFEDRFVRPTLVGTADDRELLDLLRQISEEVRPIRRIFVDYSSMSKLWYGAILNWARYLEGVDGVVVDFGYVVAQPTIPYKQAAVQSIEAIPGFEVTTGFEQGILLLGVGFDRFTAMSIVDQMEPDKLIVFLADPSTEHRFVEVAEKTYESLVGGELASSPLIRLPLLDVEHAFRLLAEIVQPYARSARVTIVPLGPKTHVLASLLVSMRFGHVGCLRVGTSTVARKAPAAHHLSITRVEIGSPVQ